MLINYHGVLVICLVNFSLNVFGGGSEIFFAVVFELL